MTVRNRHHSMLTISIGAVIKMWLKTQPTPRGQVYGGEIGVLLHGTEGSTVGVDVVYAPPEVVEVQSDDETTLLDGIPTLAVEILSPNDTVQQINEKIKEFLTAGVPLVWLVDPYLKTVMLLRPGRAPDTFNITQQIPECAEMPGFSPTVAELFE